MKRSRLAADAGTVALAAVEIPAVWSLIGPVELVLYIVTALLLVVWRYWPVPVLLLTLPAAMTGLLLAPMIAMCHVAFGVRRRAVIGACAGLLFAVALVPWRPMQTEVWSYEDGLRAVISSALLALGPTAVGALARMRRELAEHIDELMRSRERERKLLARSAVAEERARLAREMHDVVAHNISLIAVQAGALRSTAQTDASRETASTIGELSRRTLHELRAMVSVLRSGEAPGRAGTHEGTVEMAVDGPGLAELPALLRVSGDHVRYEAAVPARRWPKRVEQAAYRIVQEAVTNARKHATGACVTVALRESAGSEALLVEVRNGPRSAVGTGAAAYGEESRPLPSSGFGLIGLRERAEALGGWLEARPTADGGFSVRAALPAPTGGTPPVGGV
ncbi:sensor histidine kinase [Streptomyces sp. YGL11-2]|uniref:sensor histidine kinase n=1 Tax=Streptomyces sp. YGL11-2 TaxID=3414028 RepID=UPI003CE81E63